MSQPIFEAIPLGLNSSGALFAGEDQASGHLDEFVPPYTGVPAQVGALGYAIALVVDKRNNVWVTESGSVQEYSPPTYRLANTLRHHNQVLFYPQSITMLPSGQLAVGRMESKAGVTAAPGAVDIYTQIGAHHFKVMSVKGVPYPEALAVDRKGDIIVADCPGCVSAGEQNNALLIIPRPYKSAKVLQKLPNVTLTQMIVGSNGELFVEENGEIVVYRAPFKHPLHLKKTVEVSGIALNSAGDLIYSEGSNIYFLPPPYTGTPQLVYTSLSGLPEEIVTTP